MLKLPMAALALALMAMPATAKPLACTWTKTFQCGRDAACQPSARPVSGIMDASAGTYRRCVDARCTTFPIAVSRESANVLNAKGDGIALTFANDGKATEVTHDAHGVVMSNGVCR